MTTLIPGQREPSQPLRPLHGLPRDPMIDWHEAMSLLCASRGEWAKAEQHAKHSARLEALDAYEAWMASSRP